MVAINRIPDFLSLLKTNRRTLTRKFLQTRWSCSAPTIHRTVDKIRKDGVPIIFKNGSYWLELGKAIEAPGFWFSPDEMAALLGLSHWLERLASGVLEEKIGPIRNRIEELLKSQGIEILDWKDRIRLLSTHFRPINPDTLLSSARAVLMRQQISFLYAGIKDNKPKKRNVSPQTLVHYRDNWYLDGWDHDFGKLREFALSRVRDLEIVSRPALDIDRKKLDSHFGEAYGIFPGRARQKAVLIFEGLAGKLVSEECWHPKQKTSHLSSGKIRIEFPCGNVSELARDVMRFADEVTIVGPKTLQVEFAGMVQRAGVKLGTLPNKT